MPVLVTSEVPGQTPEGYDHVLALVEDAIRAAPGFIVHAAHPDEGCWRLMELWQTKQDADRFFANHVAPSLPPGIRPKRSYRELHAVVQP
jgi:hypothetical protein